MQCSLDIYHHAQADLGRNCQQVKVPASLRTFAIIHAVTDVISLGLHTTVLPAAIAGASLNVNK